MGLIDVMRMYVAECREGIPCSMEDMAERTDTPLKEVVAFFKLSQVKQALSDKYDLPPPPLRHSKKILTAQQKRWIEVASNPYSGSPTSARATAFGISMATHRRWMRQPAFRDAYNKAIATDAAHTKGDIIRMAAHKAMSGDVKAVELIHRLNGTPLAELPSANPVGQISVGDLIPILQRVLSEDDLASVAGAIMSSQLGLPSGTKRDHITQEDTDVTPE